jgi:hypothetical protein
VKWSRTAPHHDTWLCQAAMRAHPAVMYDTR